VREDKIFQDGNHEWVRAVFDEAVYPELKASVQSELRAEDLVLTEDQEEASDGDAEKGQREIVARAREFWVCHVGEIVIENLGIGD
jgi:hypothetical protein